MSWFGPCGTVKVYVFPVVCGDTWTWDTFEAAKLEIIVDAKLRTVLNSGYCWFTEGILLVVNIFCPDGVVYCFVKDGVIIEETELVVIVVTVF